MGNPDAALKLVEYGSLSCAFCAKFHAEAGASLRDLVAGGRMSWEFRSFLIFPSDIGLSLLLDCRAPSQRFELVEAIYRSQAEWMGRIQALPTERLNELQILPPGRIGPAFVEAGGMDRLFREQGMSEAEIRNCLGDPAGPDRLAARTVAWRKDDVLGTPTFLINERQAEAPDWKRLEPQLKAALRELDAGR